jgi:uncharacterized membrane protein
MKSLHGVLIVFLCLVMAGAAGFVFLKEYDAAPAPVAPSETREPALEDQFETLFNTMLRDVESNIRAYRQQRKVFEALAQEENILDPAYIAENYALMQSMGPQLRIQIGNILAIFDKADSDFQKLLEKYPQSERTKTLESWQALQFQSVQPYRDYFRIEEEILSAYEDLMTFYYVNAQSFSFDRDLGVIIFAAPEQKSRVNEISDKISRLSALQGEVLRVQP